MRHAWSSMSGSLRRVVIAAAGTALVLSGTLAPLAVSAAGSQPSSTALVSSQNPSPLGTAVTYTATVSGSSGTPTGTVTFTDGVTTLCSGPVGLTTVNGTSADAMCTETGPSMTAGGHSITASYNGDGTYNTSSDSITQTVNTDTTATAVTSSLPTGSVVGVPVTYTATVTAGAGESAISPGGTVTFADNGTTICTATSPATASGGASTWTCLEPGASMTLGSHSIVATYAGDSNFGGSDNSATPFVQTVGQNTTTTTLSSSPPSPSPVGTAVTYTATVTAGSGVTAFSPTGMVTFTDGATICTVNSPSTSANGVSTWLCVEPASSMTAGPHTITATYGGDTNFTGSNKTITQTVNGTTSTTGVTSSQNPSAVGTAVTYTATVSAGGGVTAISPTGTVTFTDGATICTVNSPTTTGGGQSTYECTEPATSMTAGSHAIAAGYGGDTNFSASSGNLTQTVNKGATTTVVTSPGPSSGGLAVTYTATVSSTAPSGISPTGTVTFKDATSTICTVTSPTTSGAGSSAYQCTEPATSMTSGTHQITAVYSGDTNFTGSDNTSSPFPQVVAPGTISITEAANPASPSDLGVAVTYTATVTTTNGSTIAPSSPTPNVTFTDTTAGWTCTPAQSLANPTPGQATASCTEPASYMTGGTHAISISYGGDQYFESATQGFSQVVSMHPSGSSTAITTSDSPSYPGAPVTYTAVVTGDTVIPPSGPVTFTSDTQGTLCASVSPSAVNDNTATYTCTVSGTTMPDGSQEITADFLGDISYGGSSANLTQNVSVASVDLVITSATNPSLAGNPVTYTATLTPNQGADITPSGTIAFFDNGVPIAACAASPLTPGAGSTAVATCTEPSQLMVTGTHPITAIYAGDNNYLGSDDLASQLNQVVNPNTTTTTPSVSGPGSPPYPAGQPLTVSATVSANPGGNQLTPTGTVTFVNHSGSNSYTLCTATLSGSGGTATASCTPNPSSPYFTVSPAGTIVATYNADANFSASVGSTPTPAFSQATPVAAISTSRQSSAAGAAVTYTATFADPNGGLVAPTGPVTFTDGVTTVCSLSSPSSTTGGVSTYACTEPGGSMTAGQHLITATFGGDANFVSAAASLTQNVVQADTSTAITANAPPTGTIYPVQTPLTLTATVTADQVSVDLNPPFPDNNGNLTDNGDGFVTFLVNKEAVPGCTDLPVTQTGLLTGTASCSTTMPQGNLAYTAYYSDTSGDTGYATSPVSSPVNYTIVYYSTDTTVSVNPASPVSGQPVTFTATVNPRDGYSVLPTGTIVFVVNGNPVTCDTGVSDPTLNTNNPPTATCTVDAGLAGGVDSVQAAYPGNGIYAASTGSLAVTVTRAPTVTAVVARAASSPSVTPVSGQTLRFDVTVAPNGSYAGTPTGQVAITTPGVAGVLCTVTLSAGAGTCNDTGVPVPWGTNVPFSATYAGDSSFSGSAGQTTLTINPQQLTVSSISVSPSPSSYGQPLTFTVAVTPQIPGSVATGPVTITSSTAGLGTLCTVTLTSTSNNTGSCTFTSSPTAPNYVPAGAVQFKATYGGDADFAGGEVGQTNSYVRRATPTVALTINPQNPVYGQYPTFGITVTPPVAGTVPTGTVTVTSNDAAGPGQVLCTYTVGTTPNSCTDTLLLAAQNNVTFTATYSGDGNFTMSTGTVQANVQQATTTTSVTATSAAYGQPVTFSVTVAPQIPGVTPTGTVVLTAPGITGALCTITLGVGGTGTCGSGNATIPPGGNVTYMATYLGDPNFLPSSATTTGSVTQTGSSTVLTFNPKTVAYGSENTIPFTVTVSPNPVGGGTPTGTATVKTGSTTLCTVTLSAGTGVCNAAAAALAASGTAYPVTATYNGDTNFTGSTSAGVNLTVTQATPTETLTVVPSTLTYGQESAGVFTVTVTSPGGGTPTGSVPVKSGATTLCTVTLVNGTGTCSPADTALPVTGSPFTITAPYPGDTNFSSATASTSLRVVGSSATTTLTVSPASVAYGNEHTVTISATVASTGAGIPTGTVTVTANGTSLCTITLASGSGTCAALANTVLGAGSYSLVATYNGDANFGVSTSTAKPLTVTQNGTTTTLTFTPTTVAYGSENTVPFTVTVSPTNSGTPTGTATVKTGADHPVHRHPQRGHRGLQRPGGGAGRLGHRVSGDRHLQRGRQLHRVDLHQHRADREQGHPDRDPDGDPVDPGLRPGVGRGVHRDRHLSGRRHPHR